MSLSLRSSGVSASSNPMCVGELQLMSSDGKVKLATKRIYTGHEMTVGRDRNKCQWVLIDPYLSAKHLRIYTIIYDNEEEAQREYLVYAEDLSRHGVYWNGSLIGKGNGGFLLCDKDKLRLSRGTTLFFNTPESPTKTRYFDMEQEVEMHCFNREYKLTNRLLGSGMFGQVFMAIEQHTRTQVACKVVDLRKLERMKSKHFPGPLEPVKADQVVQSAQTEKIKTWAGSQREGSQLETYRREVDILSQLSHPNIIAFDKVYVTDNHMYIFQDLITAGDLFSYLESKNGKLLEVEAAVIIRQILVALQFLHAQNIVHRDLKPENIMMTSLSTGCRVVLTDFGSARRVKSHQRMVSFVGSEPYAAPEVRAARKKNGNVQNGYTKAIDMWSVGTITVVLLTGASAFTDPSTGSFSRVLAHKCDLQCLQRTKDWQKIRPRPQDFITRLLVLDERQRMDAQGALKHVWFSNEIHRTDFEDLYQRTIKNWYPRVAKNPVIEFVGSSFNRHFVPSRDVVAQKRPRRDGKPIDPPYKPFPRNMHTSLWPKRKSLGHVMSDEVQAAITEMWTGKPKTIFSHSKTNVVPASGVTKVVESGKGIEASGIPASNSVSGYEKVTNVQPQPSRNGPTLISTVVPVRSYKGLATTSKHVVTESAQEKAKQPRDRFMSLIKDAADKKNNPSRSSSTATPGLRRRSTSGHTGSNLSQVRRRSSFDLDEDNAAHSDAERNLEPVSSNKKQKREDTEAIDSVQSRSPPVVAHNKRVMMCSDLEDVSRVPYLPRI